MNTQPNVDTTSYGSFYPGATTAPPTFAPPPTDVPPFTPPPPKPNTYRPIPDELPYAPEGCLIPTVASMLHFLVSYPFDDLTRPMCQCGCKVHDEINTCISDLCYALFIQSGWDYSEYHRLVEACLRVIDFMKISEPARIGFITHARNIGVTNYAWAIVDTECALASVAACDKAYKDHGLGNLRYIISMGAGGGYVEYVFNNAIKKSHWRDKVQLLAYDSYPSTTPYLPVQTGTPQNLCSDFKNVADCCLMLCWPPLGSPLSDGSYNPNPDPNNPTNTMASDALRNFASRGGRGLLYIGERTIYGCTGDPKFHELLEQHWELVNADENGESTVPMFKWCPQPSAVPNGYAPEKYQIGGVSGNDNVWVYVLKDPTPYMYPDQYGVNESPKTLPPPFPAPTQQQHAAPGMATAQTTSQQHGSHGHGIGGPPAGGTGPSLKQQHPITNQPTQHPPHPQTGSPPQTQHQHSSHQQHAQAHQTASPVHQSGSHHVPQHHQPHSPHSPHSGGSATFVPPVPGPINVNQPPQQQGQGGMAYAGYQPQGGRGGTANFQQFQYQQHGGGGHKGGRHSPKGGRGRGGRGRW
eukprot:TRINITY_DN74997_c0_g1_i1.p1 TRINITY_DN74997_c0_g1~~TRINITY_DN74997_c0_g1_i1.p1  ORF type:complete len:596 (+),score=41.05 TRINITY_DN74997_c0_g1_i1:47-1789(+)